jgi:hypothetical protein
VWWWRILHIKGVMVNEARAAWGGGPEAPSESSPDFDQPARVASLGVAILLGGAFVESSLAFPVSEQAI